MPPAPQDELLAFAIAHEVRNLLTPARAYTEMGHTAAALRGIDRALAFADAVLEGGGPVECDVGAAIANAAESVGSTWNADGPALWAAISPAVLERVVANLLLNAREAGATGTVRYWASGSGCSIEVLDNGPGLPREARPGRGRGRGLQICMFLVEQVGGRLSLQSSPGKGTVATIELPLALPQQQAA